MTNQDQLVERIFLVSQIILIVAWAYFIFFHLTHYHPIEYPNSAEGDFYIRIAYARTEGRIPRDPYRPILYVLMTIGVRTVLDTDFFFAGKLVSHLFSILFIITTILIGNKLFSRGVALLSATFLILTYIVNFTTVTAATDMAFSATALFALLIGFYYSEKKNYVWLTILAFVTAMSYFLRYTSVFLAVPIGILFIHTHWNNKINFLKHAGVFTVLVLIFLVPHMYFTYQTFGEPFYSEAWKNLNIKLYSDINRFDSFFSLLRNSYPLLIETGLESINRFFLTGLDGFTTPQISILRWIFHTTFFVGLYQAYKQNKVSTIVLFAFFIIYIFFVGFTFHLMNRLIVVILPIYFLFIANGFHTIVESLTNKKRVQLVSMGLLLCATFAIYAPHLMNQLNTFYDEHTIAEHNAYLRLYEQGDDIAIVGSDTHAWRLGNFRPLLVTDSSVPINQYFELVLERIVQIDANYVVVGSTTGKHRNVPEKFATGELYPEWLTIIESNTDYIVYDVDEEMVVRLTP